MQQSNVIFGVLLVAYLVFITLRGELPVYLDILRGGGATSGNGGSGAGIDASGGILGSVNSVEKQAENLLSTPNNALAVSSFGSNF